MQGDFGVGFSVLNLSRICSRKRSSNGLRGGAHGRWREHDSAVPLAQLPGRCPSRVRAAAVAVRRHRPPPAPGGCEGALLPLTYCSQLAAAGIDLLPLRDLRGRALPERRACRCTCQRCTRPRTTLQPASAEASAAPGTAYHCVDGTPPEGCAADGSGTGPEGPVPRLLAHLDSNQEPAG